MSGSDNNGDAYDGSHHLDCPLNVNLAVQTQGPYLVNNHVYHNKSSCSADSCRAVHDYRPGRF